MPSSACTPPIEPFIDNLWFYSSVISPSASSPLPVHPQPPDLPLSSGGLTFPSHDPQLQELHRVFDAIDENRDGQLSEQELCRWMKTLGLQYTDDGMIRMITSADCDGNGSLDFAEFVSLTSSVLDEQSRDQGHDDSCWRSEASLKEVFGLFDKDRNGLISPQELCVTLANLGLLKNGKEEDCVNMINRVDTDGDGQVNFSEFQTMMHQQQIPIKLGDS